MAPIYKESPVNNDSFRYVIGIDFGTTYSGAGYMFIKNASRKEVTDIKNWPRNRGNPNFKIPTVIRYNKKDRKIYKCGLEAISLPKKEIGEYDNCIDLFKLHLSEKHKDDLPKLPEDLDIVTIISDYLRYLYQNICIDMQKTLGTDNSTFEKTIQTFRYCLTVPAIWTDDAKLKMREACILAGIIDRDDHTERLLMVGEPEAAALYAEQMKGGVSIQSGERLMIVDAGGGTVDLITFEKTIQGDIKSFKEIVDGDGNSLGSSQLDQNFKEFIVRNTSNRFRIDDKSLDQLVETFRTETKLIIDHETPEEPVYLKLPIGLHNRTVDDGNGFKIDVDTLSISTQRILDEIFNPVIEEVIYMINFQLDALGKNILHYIILVGGFGQNTYLLRCIREKYANEDRVCDIIVPDVRELAVARGAVFFGLDPYSISHRRMRYSYGVSIYSPFNESLDNPEYKIFNKDGKPYCQNRFDCIVRKGQDVSIQECISREYKTENSKTFIIQLYSFAGKDIPRYVSVNDESEEDTAAKVATFVVPLPSSHGKDTPFKVDMYFGHMEIKIDVKFDGFEEKRTFTASY